MATHSSILAWEITRTEEPDSLQSMGSQKSWTQLVISWRRERIPSPVFWPGEFHGQRILAGYSPWDPKEWDILEFSLSQFQAPVFIHHLPDQLNLNSFFEPETQNILLPSPLYTHLLRLQKYTIVFPFTECSVMSDSLWTHVL